MRVMGERPGPAPPPPGGGAPAAPTEGASNPQPVLHHAGVVSAQNLWTEEHLCAGPYSVSSLSTSFPAVEEVARGDFPKCLSPESSNFSWESPVYRRSVMLYGMRMRVLICSMSSFFAPLYCNATDQR
jgi:hypothetical protein